MSNDNMSNQDDDITLDVMTTLSAALAVNPKFNFGKLMDLSTDINSSKNKPILLDMISLAFLNYLEMNDAAETLSSENIAAGAGFKALNLDNKEALEWFIRFLAVMNPGILATLSQTLLNVVNGLMIQNTRTADGDRLFRAKAKLDKFIESGELVRRTEKLIEAKPASERSTRKETTNYGLLGWIAGANHNGRRQSKSSSGSSSNTGKASDKHKDKPTSSRTKNNTKDKEEDREGTLTKYIEDIDLNGDEIDPSESASNISVKLKESKSKYKPAPTKSSMRKGVRMAVDDSIVSG